MVIREQKMSLDEYRAVTELPENRDRHLEWIDGEIVEKMGSFTPSRIALEIARFLGNYLAERRLGYITGADGSYLMSLDGQMFIPDVGYISRARLPQAPAREVPLPPDLAVKVKSPTDRVRDLRKKAEQYLAYGTAMVWLVLPEANQVEVYTPDDDVQVFGLDDTISGGAVLPDFTLSVSAIFAGD